MKTFLQAIQQNPLGISVVALLTSLFPCGALFALGQKGFYFDRGAFTMAVFCVCLSAGGVLNLIQAERRGYSSTRIGLSVLALAFSFFPSVSLILKLWSYIGEQP